MQVKLIFRVLSCVDICLSQFSGALGGLFSSLEVRWPDEPDRM
jgi:hypothetical protein